MFVKKSEIEDAIKSKIKEYQEWVNARESRIFPNKNNRVGCVFVQQFSARKYHVDWRFTKQGTLIGDIQKDYHTAYNPNQEIVWVA